MMNKNVESSIFIHSEKKGAIMHCFHFLILISLITLPIVGYSSDEKYKEYIVEKRKLKCLYEEIDSLLNEESDPVWLLLRNQCNSSSKEKERIVINEPKPLPNPKPPSENSSTGQDILRLSKNQLRCFKKSYSEFIKQDGDPITVRFLDECIAQK